MSRELQTTINSLYEYGAYETIKNMDLSNRENLILSLILNIQRDLSDDDKHFIISDNSVLKTLLYSMWNLSIVRNDIFEGVPVSTTGINTLIKLDSIHSNYILYNYYVNIDPYTGNKYLVKSAKLGAIDARNKLRSVGINWESEDQFCDHCSLSICPMPENGCIGCGSDPSNDGWIYCNYLLCRIKTELNCSSIADYSVSGFMSLLRILEFPLKLGACVSSIVALGTQQAGYNSGIPLFIATGFTTLVAFVQKQENKN